MGFAETFGAKNELGSHLSLSALYELAAPSTPPEVREEIERRIAADAKKMKQQAQVMAGRKRSSSDDGLRRHPVTAETPINHDRGFSVGLRKLTEGSHRLAAAVADSNLGLIRLAHVRIILQRDRHRCTKTANQHQNVPGCSAR